MFGTFSAMAWETYATILPYDVLEAVMEERLILGYTSSAAGEGTGMMNEHPL